MSETERYVDIENDSETERTLDSDKESDNDIRPVTE
jgi:hypothetical protein